MTVPQISALPEPPRRTDAQADFSLKADAFLGALPRMAGESNASVVFVNARASAAEQSAASAGESESAANASKLAAAASETAAAASSSSAAQSAQEAAQAAGIAVAARDTAVQAADTAASTAEDIDQKLASIADGPVVSVLGLGGVVTLEDLAAGGLAKSADLGAAQQSLAEKASLAGEETLSNKTLAAPVIDGAKKVSSSAYVDKTVTVAAATGTVTLSLSQAGVFVLTLSGNTALAISNAPELGGETLSIVVRVTQPGTAYALTWFGGITWLSSGGVAPAAPAAGRTTEYVLSTSDGASWIGRKGASN